MIQKTIYGFRLATILLVGYWCVLFILTHLPKTPSIRIQHADKLVHFIAYAGLAALLAWSLPKHRVFTRRHLWLSAAVAAVYAAFDEILQVPVGRTADIADWAADLLGILAGLMAYSVARRQFVKRHRSRQALSTKPLEALRA